METKFLFSSYLFTLVKKPQNRHVIRLKPSVNRALPAAEFNGTLREKLFLILLNFFLKVTLCEEVTGSDGVPMWEDFLG